MGSRLAALMLALVILAVGALVAMRPAVARASGGDDPRFSGLVTSKPSGGNVGNWVLGNRIFVANGSTEFNFQSGPLDVGVCAKAKYASANRVDTTIEIESQPATDCGPNATGTPSPSGTGTVTGTITPSPSPSPTASPTPEPVASNRAVGLLSAFPANLK